MDVRQGRSITSWSAYHIPAGCPVDYRMNPGDDAVLVIIGDREEINLELAPESLTSLITTLREARMLLDSDN